MVLKTEHFARGCWWLDTVRCTVPTAREAMLNIATTFMTTRYLNEPRNLPNNFFYSWISHPSTGAHWVERVASLRNGKALLRRWCRPPVLCSRTFVWTSLAGVQPDGRFKTTIHVATWQIWSVSEALVFQVCGGNNSAYDDPRAPVHIVTGSAVIQNSSWKKHRQRPNSYSIFCLNSGRPRRSNSIQEEGLSMERVSQRRLRLHETEGPQLDSSQLETNFREQGKRCGYDTLYFH